MLMVAQKSSHTRPARTPNSDLSPSKAQRNNFKCTCGQGSPSEWMLVVSEPQAAGSQLQGQESTQLISHIHSNFTHKIWWQNAATSLAEESGGLHADSFLTWHSKWPPSSSANLFQVQARDKSVWPFVSPVFVSCKSGRWATGVHAESGRALSVHLTIPSLISD